MYKPVSSRVSFPQLEENIIRLWKDKDAFKRSVEQREGGPRFNLYEGPPTMNGNPSIHGVMPRVIKDVIPRFKAMKGYYAPRIGGWDTHGLPVELEIEKKLGFSGKTQIEEYGVEKFNALCRESVLGYISEFEEMTERIGFWVDMENAYVTMNNDYIESVWWTIKQMWDKGLVYQGNRVTPHCPRCQTSLSSHEVAQGYKDDIEDPSVYIKFKVVKAPDSPAALKDLPGDKSVYLLAWTTTPWTLPGNTALAVSGEAEYAVVETDAGYLVLANARLGELEPENYRVAARLQGKDLVGAVYEPLFNPHEYGIERQRFQGGAELQKQAADGELTYRVISADFVSMDDGTGIVHVAPAYGEVDYEAGQTHGLDFVHTVDLQGRVIGEYPFAGEFVKEADPLVLAELEKAGLLFRAGTISHTYPFCWRCDSPLLYYAKQSWYIRTTARKEQLLSGNEQINWYPDHIKHGRFGDWLENNVDWAFSRERYWGTPLPVWRCRSCGELECVGGVEELKNKKGFSGPQGELDLHRPYVDEMTYECPACGGRMHRQPEVIDCWFDSGSMPVAQLHYPFENGTMLEDGRFPADYICEAIDQTRGWFYTLHAISTLVFDRPCFENVICHGHILDAKGEKMSKSRGNVVDYREIIEKYGADALRWYIYTAAPMGNSMRFDDSQIAEISRRLLMTLWNVYSFFVTYANIDNFAPDPENAPLRQAQGKPIRQAQGKPVESELDRWILSELNQLVKDVDAALESYDPRTAAWKTGDFIDGLSNWYVRRSRRRFWKSENDTDKLSAYNTLYQCLVTLTKLMAPITPFLAEELYQNLVVSVSPEAPESVHLADFPVADESLIDEELDEANRLAMKVSSLGRAARSKAGIKVRQPLAVNYIGLGSERERRALESESIRQTVLEELNVKEIVAESLEEVQSRAEKEPEKYVLVSEGGINSAVFTELTEELRQEGMAREIVHRLQTMRRNAGFEITDHINTFYQGDEYIHAVMGTYELAHYIAQETLSRHLIDETPGEVDISETFTLDGHPVTLGVQRLE